jgi:hypothetical protein
VDNFIPGEQSDDYWEICPYCGNEVGDSTESLNDRSEIRECYECKKQYLAWVEYSVEVCTSPVDDE